MKKNNVKRLVFTALFTALIVVATAFVSIPLPLGGYVHLGDAFLFLATFILGPVYGVIASGLGSAIADLIGYPTYALATLIIKALMSLIAYFFYYWLRKATKKTVLAEIVAGVTASVFMALGYFVFEVILYGTATVAISIPWNILQGVVGVAIAVATMRILEKNKMIRTLKDK